MQEQSLPSEALVQALITRDGTYLLSTNVCANKHTNYYTDQTTSSCSNAPSMCTCNCV